MPDRFAISETLLNSSIDVFLLAAGQSARMGESKPLLTFDGTTILERMVSAFRLANLTRIHVVGRMDDHKLAEAVHALGAAFVINSRPDLEMAGSILLAIENCDAEWLVVCPADMPLLTSVTVSACVSELACHVVQPSIEGRAKHPVFVHRRVFSSLHAQLAAGSTLRDCLAKIEARAFVECSNLLEFRDVDTPEDVAALIRALR